MILKLWGWLREHGYAVMIVGMAVTALGAIMLFQSQRTGGITRQPALAIGIAGVAIYVLGRVAVLFRRNRPRKTDELDEE